MIVSGREIEPGTIWTGTWVEISPPQPIIRFRVKALEAVWGTEEERPSTDYTLCIYEYLFGRSNTKDFSLSNCAEETKEIIPRPQLVSAVRFICWQVKGKPQVLGLMRYVMEVEQALPFLSLTAKEKSVDSVKHYHRC